MSPNKSYFSYKDDISQGLEKTKISFVNELDNDQLPQEFEYTACNVLGDGASVEDFESVPKHCECTDLCSSSTSCFCLTTYGVSYRNFRLLDTALSGGSRPVIECSMLCRCVSLCPNRVVQRGIAYKLQVFKTRDKEFGVRTLETIPKLAFVCEYAGEVIGLEETKRRLQCQEPDSPNYVFILREKVGENQVTCTVVDPTHTGNVGRFINHSCSPNLAVVPVRVDCLSPRLCFFSLREIPHLEELCYDYGAINSAGYSSKRCACGSAVCRMYLPFCADAFSETVC